MTLFDQESLHDRFMQRRSFIVDHIGERGADALGQDVVAELVGANRVEPIVLDINGRWMERPVEKRERVADPMYPQMGRLVTTVEYTQVVPFTGSRMLLRMRPMRFQSTPQHCEVTEQAIRITVVVAEHTSPEDIRRRLDEALSNIAQHIEWARPTIDEYHQWLQTEIPAHLDARRAQVAEAAARTDAVGLPVRAPAPPRRPAPRPAVAMVNVAPSVGPAPSRGKILTLLVDFCGPMSRTPGTWETMTEEAIRDTMVAAINPQFPGGIIAEGFNGRGKADIIVRSGNMNALIVELKFWSGRKDFADALIQLLSYTSWRDTSIAVIPIFTIKGVTEALYEVIAEVEALPNWVAPSPGLHDTRMDFLLHADGDPHQQVTLAVLPVPLITSARPGVGRPRKRRAASNLAP